MNRVRSQTKGVNGKVTIDIQLFCLIAVATILGFSANSRTTQLNQFSLKNYPDVVKAASTNFVKPDTVTQARVNKSYGKLPMSFELNVGQTDSKVKFLSRGRGSTLFLTPSEAVLVLTEMSKGKFLVSSTKSRVQKAAPVNPKSQSTVLRMKLVGANSQTEVVGLQELHGKANYFIGNDKTKWRRNIPTYAKVKHRDVYPGVDLIYYGNQQQLEYDFVVSTGTDPKIITLEFDGLVGADLVSAQGSPLQIDAQGDLMLHTAGGQIRLHKPIVYQEVDGVRQEISASYVLKDKHQVGFEVAAYDVSKPLLIDPVLVYSTYLGGSGSEFSSDIAVDDFGNAYVTGNTSSTNFPTTVGSFQTALGGGADAFVAKLNAAGNSLIYSTYLGGSGDENFFPDFSAGIAVDIDGNAYVTGHTNSTNFPTTAGAFQTTFGGGNFDGFVAKLNVWGSALVFSTYLGGGSSGGGLCCGASDVVVDITVEHEKTNPDVYVVGFTDADDFPTTMGAFQPVPGGGGSDGFITKLNDTGSALIYSSFFGGGSSDHCNGIAIDSNGNSYVTGSTGSTNFPISGNPFQSTHGGADSDGFVAKVNATGSALMYSTYLGGINRDDGRKIAVDTEGNAYVIGAVELQPPSSIDDFPTTPGALQTTYGGGRIDAFVAKLNPDPTVVPATNQLVYSTYIGGSNDDGGSSIVVDTFGNAYLIGGTDSVDFPTVSPFQTDHSGSFDVFVSKLNANGSALVYSTYLGGSDDDRGGGITRDVFGNVYVSGKTSSPNFPTTPGAFDTTFNGVQDAFVAKIAENQPPLAICQNVTVSADATCQGSADVNNGSFDPDNDPITLAQSPPGPYNSGTTSVTLTVTDDNGVSDSCTATVTVVDDTPPAITCPANQTTECTGPDGAFVFFSTTATDNCSGALTTCAPPSGSTFPLGNTTDGCTATDGASNKSTCSFTVTVVDTTPPEIECNSPENITPSDAPTSFTATAIDKCGASSVNITTFDCFFLSRSGRKIDKKESCVVEVNGDTVTIVDSGGIGDHITWSVTATDSSGNTTGTECEVVVENPGQGGG